MKLTAMVPVYNDDYTLSFCLASLIDHFDEIVVFDDASTDHTPDVALSFGKAVRYFRHEGRQLGWIDARNEMMKLTDSKHLFWLDSDDVLCEYEAARLAKIATGRNALVRLGLAELWGDLNHTTQRLRHHDRCHTFMNRKILKDLKWSGGTVAKCKPTRNIAVGSAPVMFFHIKGVKPDRRIAARHLIRGWMRMEDRPDNLDAMLADMDEEKIHQIAMNTILRSKQDKLRPTYLALLGPKEKPRRPAVIRAALPGRFMITYTDGQPTDRVDLGWSPPASV